MEIRAYNKQRKIAILGGGSMGTAIAIVCAKNGYSPFIWSIEPEVVQTINHAHHNHKYLPRLSLHNAIRATSSAEEALSYSAFIISALPTQVVCAVCKEYAGLLTTRHHLLSVSKGFVRDTGKTVSASLERIIPQARAATLMGPLFAREIAQGCPSVALLASSHSSTRAIFRKILLNSSFRIHESADIIGAESSGALKNIYAILMGVLAGLNYGWNTKSAFMVMALREMADIIEHLGGKRETVYGLAGVGDLITTGLGDQSRNRAFGQALCSKKSVKSAVASVGQVVEGVETLAAVEQALKGCGKKQPLLWLIRQLVRDGADICGLIERFIKKKL